MEDKKISIIIPAYNVEDYIERGITSSLNQTYNNIEIIVVDDGSSDSTYNRVKDLSEIDSRIKLYAKKNGGVSSARNLGLDKAEGEYIVFLDSDDWLETNAIEKLLALQTKKKQLVVCDRYWVSEKKNLTERIKPVFDSEDKYVEIDDVLRQIGTGKYNLQSACYKLFEKSIIDENHIRFNENIYYGEDGLFVFEYLKHTSGIVYSTVGLWNILERKNSATTSLYNKRMLTAVDGVLCMIDDPTNSADILMVLYFYLIQRIQELIGRIVYTSDTEDIVQLRKIMCDFSRKINPSQKGWKFRVRFFYYYKAPIVCIKVCNRIIKSLKQLIKKIFVYKKR